MEPLRMPVAAVTVTAALAAAGIAASMLLAGPDGPGAASTVVLAAAQVALLLGVRSGAVRARQFLLAWSGQAGLTYLVAGDAGAESALVFLGVGLVFAAVVVAGLALWRPEPEPDAEPDAGPDGRGGGTQPLPVAEGD
ncbi:hypothetical protein [Actinomycetospora flava]|uniref:Uncharacterized protein n=1 Tax=Actinomycetospora flava TaxID=3129232 RepID=A0ABU8M6U7_9PSEU